MYVQTWNVKSNCFCISSCWLLIYSTVYLYLCRGMCRLLECVSVHVCVLPKEGGRQLAVSTAVGGIFKPKSAGDGVRNTDVGNGSAVCLLLSLLFNIEKSSLGF